VSKSGNGEHSGDPDDVEEYRPCEGPTCRKTVRVSVGRQGGRRRRFCSDACRMQRQRADKVKANAVAGGGVEHAVRQLIAQLAPEEGSMAAALGALAISAAQMADSGNPMAPGHLSKILDALDEAAPAKDDTDTFSFFWDVLLGQPRPFTKEGINPESKIGKKLLEAGRPLPTRFPPPHYPPGWSGTAVSGDPFEYAERIGFPWEPMDPLAFWSRDYPECPACGHRFDEAYEAREAEHDRLSRAELDAYREKGRAANAARSEEARNSGRGSQHPSWMTGGPR
jgi:hypothetical protein